MTIVLKEKTSSQAIRSLKRPPRHIRGMRLGKEKQGSDARGIFNRRYKNASKQSGLCSGMGNVSKKIPSAVIKNRIEAQRKRVRFGEELRQNE